MKKKYIHSTVFKILLTLAVGFNFLSLSKAQTSAIIGAGALSGTSSNGTTGDPGPMYRSSATSAFIFSRYHYLYTATELAAAGITAGSQITKLAWFKNNSAKTNSACLFEAWIKNSNLTVVGAGGQQWATLITGSTPVYANSAHQVDTVIGWHEIIFNSAYLYTGGALEISTNFDISQGTNPWSSAGFSWKKDNATSVTLSYCGSALPGLVLPNLRTVRPQLKISYNQAAPCIAPPIAGTVISSQNPVCDGINFSLFLSGGTNGTGQSFQWDSSPDSLVWTPIAGATLQALGIIQSVQTYYRCTITCSAQSSTTAGLKVGLNSYLNCYCASNATSLIGADIGKISFAGLNNGIGTPAMNNVSANNAYTDYTSLAATTVVPGATYPLTITQINSGTTTTTSYTTAYIDFNHNGSFETIGETFSIGQTSTALGNVVTGSIPIPANALLGITRMRVLLRTGGSIAQTVCGTYSAGETEDYLLFLDIAGGVASAATKNNFSIAPNPASEFVSINFTNFTADVANLRVFDAASRTMYTEIIEATKKDVHLNLDIKNYPKGIYFVQVRTISGISTSKMIIE